MFARSHTHIDLVGKINYTYMPVSLDVHFKFDVDVVREVVYIKLVNKQLNFGTLTGCVNNVISTRNYG